MLEIWLVEVDFEERILVWITEHDGWLLTEGDGDMPNNNRRFCTIVLKMSESYTP